MSIAKLSKRGALQNPLNKSSKYHEIYETFQIVLGFTTGTEQQATNELILKKVLISKWKCECQVSGPPFADIRI